MVLKYSFKSKQKRKQNQEFPIFTTLLQNVILISYGKKRREKTV